MTLPSFLQVSSSFCFLKFLWTLHFLLYMQLYLVVEMFIIVKHLLVQITFCETQIADIMQPWRTISWSNIKSNIPLPAKKRKKNEKEPKHCIIHVLSLVCNVLIYCWHGKNICDMKKKHHEENYLFHQWISHSIVYLYIYILKEEKLLTLCSYLGQNPNIASFMYSV